MRIIEVSGEITEPLTAGVAKELGQAVQNGEKELTLRIDTYGGSVKAVDNLKECVDRLRASAGLKVTALIRRAHSAGFLIAGICDERLVDKNSECVLHVGTAIVNVTMVTRYIYGPYVKMEAKKQEQLFEESVQRLTDLIQLNEPEKEELRSTGYLYMKPERVVETGFAQLSSSKIIDTPVVDKDKDAHLRTKTNFRLLPQLPNLIRINIFLSKKNIQQIEALIEKRDKRHNEVIFEMDSSGADCIEMQRLIKVLEQKKKDEGLRFTCVIIKACHSAFLMATVCDQRFVSDHSQCILSGGSDSIEHFDYLKILQLEKEDYVRVQSTYSQTFADAWYQLSDASLNFDKKERTRLYAGSSLEISPQRLIDCGFAKSIAHPDFLALIGGTT